MKRVVNASVVLFGMLLVTAMFLGAVAKPALADPAKDVTLQVGDYESAKVLEVTITHPSGNPTMEFIKSIEIKINGANMGTYTYNRQPAKKRFTYSFYDLPITSGSTVEVMVESSSFGSKTAKITVP